MNLPQDLQQRDIVLEFEKKIPKVKQKLNRFSRLLRITKASDIIVHVECFRLASIMKGYWINQATERFYKKSSLDVVPDFMYQAIVLTK